MSYKKCLGCTEVLPLNMNRYIASKEILIEFYTFVLWKCIAENDRKNNKGLFKHQERSSFHVRGATVVGPSRMMYTYYFVC